MTTLVAPWTSAVLSTLSGWDERARAVLGGCTRRLGERHEIDADLVRAAGRSDIARSLTDYDQQCRDFWQRGPKGPYVVTRRNLGTVAQLDRRDVRKDLVEELGCLHNIVGLSDYLHELLSRAPREEVLARLGEPLGASFTREGTRGAADVRVVGAAAYLPSLGGVPSAGEIARHFTFDVSWAAWRDREVRRLLRVTSAAEEMWPDPLVAAA